MSWATWVVDYDGEAAGGFAETVENIELVGGRVAAHIVANWAQWKEGVPAR